MTAILLLTMTISAEPWATGPKAVVEWDHPLTATFESAELRNVLKKLGPDRHLALVLDRRLDPNQTVTFSLRQESLRKGLTELAATLDAELVVTENVAYFGPADRARWLRTAIVQAERTMASAPAKRTPAVRKLVTWDDLDPPREILRRIGLWYQVQFDNLEMVPHDLWAGATLPNATLAEALTIVLIQLDLGWTWEPKDRRVTITKWQTPELIERAYQPRGKATVASLIDDWHARSPELSLAARENEVVVRGRVEDHEQVARWLLGGSTRVSPTKSAPPAPLSQRRFTVDEKNVPVRLVLQELEKSGVEIVLDQKSLDAAGANLDKAVSIQVQKATAEEFLKAVFDPIHAMAEIDGLTLTVRGKQ